MKTITFDHRIDNVFEACGIDEKEARYHLDKHGKSLCKNFNSREEYSLSDLLECTARDIKEMKGEERDSPITDVEILCIMYAYSVGKTFNR